MQIFEGARHRWEIQQSLEHITRIKAHLKLDLLRPDQPDADGRVPVLRLYDEPDTLLKAVGLVLHRQLKENFAKELGEGLQDEITGEPLTLLDLLALECSAERYVNLRTAFLQELQDFFRRIGLPEKGALIAKQLDLITETKSSLTKQVEGLNLSKALQQIDEASLQAAFDSQIPGNTSSNSPESSGSTPAR